MPFELFISLRYLKAKRKQVFISLINLISIGGVAVGVAALIIVLAVMTGFKNDVRDKILGIMAHIVVQKSGSNIEAYQDIIDQIRDIDFIANISPYVSAQLLINSEENVSGIRLLGIDPLRKSAVAHLESILVGFKLTPQSFENLRKDGIPENILKDLKSLEGLGISRKKEFLDAVKKQIGQVQTRKYGAFILKHAGETHVELLSETYPNLASPTGPRRDGIIIGWELARILGVFTGDEVTLISPIGHMLPTGPIPRLKKVRVAGVFSSEFYEYDAGLAYISLTSAQRFLSMGTAISGLEIRLKDLDHTKATVNILKHRLGDIYQIQDWAEMNQSLFSAINLEKLAMFLVLALIVLVAAFNIISTLVMMVMEKHSDIAILKSMGTTSNSIMKIFMIEGLVIGTIGTVIGTTLGMAICWTADTFELFSLPGGIYYLSHLPFTMTVPDIFLVVVSALVICFVSTIYPARQASKLDPVVVLRYE